MVNFIYNQDGYMESALSNFDGTFHGSLEKQDLSHLPRYQKDTDFHDNIHELYQKEHSFVIYIRVSYPLHS